MICFEESFDDAREAVFLVVPVRRLVRSATTVVAFVDSGADLDAGALSCSEDAPLKGPVFRVAKNESAAR